MQPSPKPGAGARIAFLILFIIGAGMVFITTAGPLSGPAMSWPEASLGLVPGSILFLLFHFLHVGKLNSWGDCKQATVWWAVATVFLLGLGGVMAAGGYSEADDARSALRNARSSYTPHSYGSSYDSSSLLRRDVEHYETATYAGFGLLGLSLLFMIGTALSRSAARMAALADGPSMAPQMQQPQMQQPYVPQPQMQQPGMQQMQQPGTQQPGTQQPQMPQPGMAPPAGPHPPRS